MDLHDYLNVRRTFRLLAAEWNCPVWIAKLILRRYIDQSWQQAVSDPQKREVWEAYFPKGKPTPTQYILRMGHAHENGEKLPQFSNENTI